jgi:hypothetical protein
MISLEQSRQKASTRVISDTAKEYGLKYLTTEALDQNITEEQFNNVKWFSAEVTVFNENTPLLESPISWREYQDRLAKQLATVEYKIGRYNEYPPIADQLDMIFKDIDVWRETIQAIKDKYPKPE